MRDFDKEETSWRMVLLFSLVQDFNFLGYLEIDVGCPI